MLSSVAALSFLPGPGLFRFCVVWLLAFMPYIFLTVGLNLPDTLQATIIQVQRIVLPKVNSYEGCCNTTTCTTPLDLLDVQ